MFKDRRTAMVGTLVLALFLLSLTLTNPGKALADTFLKIDGIKGESQDSKHKDEIDVISWGFGETNPAAVARSGGGARSGPVNMQDFKFTIALLQGDLLTFFVWAPYLLVIYAVGVAPVFLIMQHELPRTGKRPGLWGVFLAVFLSVSLFNGGAGAWFKLMEQVFHLKAGG
jgi:hypothetical protein